MGYRVCRHDPEAGTVAWGKYYEDLGQAQDRLIRNAQLERDSGEQVYGNATTGFQFKDDEGSVIFLSIVEISSEVTVGEFAESLYFAGVGVKL